MRSPQIPLHKPRRIPNRLDLIPAARKAVALVGVDVVAHVDAALAEAFDDLVAFGLHDARVVRALNDEEGRADLVDVGDRRARHQAVRPCASRP